MIAKCTTRMDWAITKSISTSLLPPTRALNLSSSIILCVDAIASSGNGPFSPVKNGTGRYPKSSDYQTLRCVALELEPSLRVLTAVMKAKPQRRFHGYRADNEKSVAQVQIASSPTGASWVQVHPKYDAETETFISTVCNPSFNYQ
jgi:hypothetical protein